MDCVVRCVWRGLLMCGLAVAMAFMLVLVTAIVLVLAAWWIWVRRLTVEKWPEPTWVVRLIDVVMWLRDQLGMEPDTHSEHPYNAGESNNKNAKEAIMNGKYGEDKVKELEDLKDMVREVVDMLDVVEESDNGTKFHPTHFSSCRTQHVIEFNALWSKIRAAVRPVKLAKKALKESDKPELVGFGSVNKK